MPAANPIQALSTRSTVLPTLTSKSISSTSQDHAVACFVPDKNVANDPFCLEDFPAAHDNLSDDHEQCTTSPMNDAPGQLPVLPTHKSVATHLPVDLFEPHVGADTSIRDAFVARSESLNDGLSLSLFSVGEKVQVDLLHTLKRLRAPMIAYYDEIIKWAARSCLQGGYVFCDGPIMSRKAGIEKLKSCVDLDALRPMVKPLYLPYSKCFVDVVYFSAHAVLVSFLSCPDLNQDQNLFSTMRTIRTATRLQSQMVQSYLISTREDHTCERMINFTLTV